MKGSFENPPIVITASRWGIIKAMVVVLGIGIGLAVYALYAEGTISRLLAGGMALLLFFLAWIGLKRFHSPNRLILSPEGLTVVDPMRRSWQWNTFFRFECKDRADAFTGNSPRPSVSFVLRQGGDSTGQLDDSWEIPIRKLCGLLNMALVRWGGPLPYAIPQIEPNAVPWRSGQPLEKMLEHVPLVFRKSLSRRFIFATVLIGVIGAIATLTGEVGQVLLCGVCFVTIVTMGIDGFGQLFLPARLFVTRDGIVFSGPWDEYPVPWAEIGEFYVRLNIFMYPGFAGIGYRPTSVYRLEQALGMFWEIEPKELCAFLNAAKARYGDAKK